MRGAKDFDDLPEAVRIAAKNCDFGVPKADVLAIFVRHGSYAASHVNGDIREKMKAFEEAGTRAALRVIAGSEEYNRRMMHSLKLRAEGDPDKEKK